MDFDLLEERLLRAATIVDKLPEKYRDRVMEALVDAIVSTDDLHRLERDDHEGVKKPRAREDGAPTLSGAARAFLTKHSIDRDAFASLLQQNGSEWAVFIDPDAKTKSEGQVQMALLASLRTLLSSGNFAFDAEQLKAEVKAQGYWDSGNYWKFFGKKLFSKLPTSQDPRGVLNSDGQAALSDLIKRRL